MKKRLLGFIAAFSLLLAVTTLPIPVFAAGEGCVAGGTSAKAQVLGGVGSAGVNCDKAGSGADSIFSAIVRILSLLVGAVAVIMILVAGFKYITSSGDSSKVASAKATLVYALVGLAVAVLAQFLINIVVNQSQAIADPCEYNPGITASSAECKPPKE